MLPTRRLGRILLPLALLLVLLPAATPAPTPAQAASLSQERPTTLRVGLIPNVAPDAVRARYQPFGEYLSAALGMPIELFVATDYTGVIEAMASEKLDLAWFGGLTWAAAHARAGAVGGSQCPARKAGTGAALARPAWAASAD